MAAKDELLFRDKFMTGWVILWFIPSFITFCVFIRKPLLKKRSWKVGLGVNTSFMIRSVLDIVSWTSWCITMDDSETSVAFVTDMAILASAALCMSMLYVFFIYRLWMTYNESQDNNLHIRLGWYMMLSLLCATYFVCGIILTISYYYDHTQLYIFMHSTCLALEMIMYLILCRLFSKPLIIISVRKRQLSDADRYNKEDDKFLKLLTKLNILSTLTLVTSIILRAVDIAAIIYCPDDDCTSSYVQYSLWTMDVFVNMFCILCSFTSGDVYYYRFCSKLHDYILLKCVGKMIDTQVLIKRNEAIQERTQIIILSQKQSQKIVIRVFDSLSHAKIF
eukprot:692394_1